MTYTKTVWSTGDTITATLANNWETQYDDALADIIAKANTWTASQTFNSATNQSSVTPIQATSPDGSYLGLAPSTGSGNWNPLVQLGDQAIMFNNGDNSANNSFLTIAPWANAKSGIRLGSDATVKSANNTLDDGFGKLTAAGALSSSAVGTFLFGANTGNPNIDIFRTDGSSIFYLLPWGKGAGANTSIDTLAFGTGGGTLIVRTPKNTLDNGSGNMTVAGSITSNGDTVATALSGGTQVQSGTVSVASGNPSSTSVTFPHAFSTTPVVVVAPTGALHTEYSYTGAFPFGANNISTTGFTLLANENVSATYDWFAIG